jgi:hypothetical protein
VYLSLGDDGLGGLALILVPVTASCWSAKAQREAFAVTPKAAPLDSNASWAGTMIKASGLMRTHSAGLPY